MANAEASVAPWQQTCPPKDRNIVRQHVLRKLSSIFPGESLTTIQEKAVVLEGKAFRESCEKCDYLRRVGHALTGVLTHVEYAAIGRSENALPNNVITCNICYCDKTIPSLKVTKHCSHDREVCSQCLQRHIKSEVAGKGRVNVICIADGCDVMFDYNEIRQYADAETFTLYDAALLRQAVEKDPEFCLCSSCGAGQLHVDGANVSIMSCHACGVKTCVPHRCPWHFGRTCAEYDKEVKAAHDVGLLKLWNRQNLKQCPACEMAIEKKGGCDHMTCRKESGGCGAEFCWVCLAFYTGHDGIFAIGNKAHRPSCRFYR